MKPFAAFIGAALLAGSLASCASTGSTANRVTVTEGTAPVQEKPPTQVPTSKVGMEIVSDPDRAEVWVDGNYEGLTPFIVTDIVQGWHHVIIRKVGYHEVSVWLQYTSDYLFYQASLVQITGFLRVDVSPADSVVTVGAVIVAPGLQELPVGSYPVLVRAFGYADFKDSVIISEKTVTPLSVTLAPAPFLISDLSLLHSQINPDNPGVLGVAEAQFSVSGPGTGKLEVFDKADQLLFSKDLPAFSTWNQTFQWNVRDSNGTPLPDGDYRLVVSGQGKDGEPSQQETALTVDRTLKIAPRSTWSGSSGLLYAPVAEVLPPAEVQASILGAAYSDGTVLRAPLLLGIRAGIGSRLEVDATGGIIPSSVAVPFALGAAIRWNFLSPKGEVGMEAAVEEAGAAVCGQKVVTASLGCAFYPDDGDTAEELLAEADRRMYESKEKHYEQRTRPWLMDALDGLQSGEHVSSRGPTV